MYLRRKTLNRYRNNYNVNIREWFLLFTIPRFYRCFIVIFFFFLLNYTKHYIRARSYNGANEFLSDDFKFVDCVSTVVITQIKRLYNDFFFVRLQVRKVFRYIHNICIMYIYINGTYYSVWEIYILVNDLIFPIEEPTLKQS